VITPTQILILVVTAVSLATLMYLVNYTAWAAPCAPRPRTRAWRPDGRQARHGDFATFIIGAVLAAIAGIMWPNYGTVQHTMGFLPV
jgi:branched-chain amino acid transport system permease protein